MPGGACLFRPMPAVCAFAAMLRCRRNANSSRPVQQPEVIACEQLNLPSRSNARKRPRPDRRGRRSERQQ